MPRRPALRPARSRLRVPVRAQLPPGDEARRTDPPRDRRPDGIQPARTADQPGRRAPPAPRCRRRDVAAAAGRRRPAPRHRADPRRPRRRRRRAAARRQPAWPTTSPRTASSGRRSMPRGSASDRRPPRTVGGGTPEENAALVEAVLRGEPGPRRDVVLLNAAAAFLVGGRAGGSRRGSARRLRDRRRPRDRLLDRSATALGPGRGAAAETEGASALTGATRRPSQPARHGPDAVAERRRPRSPPDGAADLAPERPTGPVALSGRADGCPAAARSPSASRRRASISSPRSSARSPSAGRIAAADERPRARARAYEAGGARAISVLCEPHWFGGSIDDLRAVRDAVAIPVLAKEFVVEDVQLPLLRAAGADLVLLLGRPAPATPARPAASTRALEIGLEPLVEAHDERELDDASPPALG